MRLLPLLALCFLPAAWPHNGDPLKSPECGQAIADLEATRADRGQDATRVEQARRRAARICLGATDEALPSGRAARPPERVPPPVPSPPRPPVAAVPAPPPSPPLEIKRAPVVTSCDPGGCWDSNATRFNRAGPNLIGPGGGVCSQQGAFLNCP